MKSAALISEDTKSLKLDDDIRPIKMLLGEANKTYFFLNRSETLTSFLSDFV